MTQIIKKFMWFLPFILLAGCFGKKEPTDSRAVITITSEPAGAAVILEGKEMKQVTPVKVRVGKEGCFLELRMDGYEPFWQQVPGETQTITAKLEAITSVLKITSDPPGAEIKIGGKSYGTTPFLSKNFALGNYEAELEAHGYAVEKIAFSINNARPVNVHVPFKSIMGNVEVITRPAEAQVYIGQTAYGKTDKAGRLQVDKLKAGNYKLTLRLEGYRDQSMTIYIQPNETTTVRPPPMESLPGAVEVTSSPEKAKVFQGDNFVGLTPLTINDLTPGMITIQVQLDGHDSQSKDVRIERGSTKAVHFDMSENLGGISFVTTPAGCSVQIDRKDMGKTLRSTNPAVSAVFMVKKLAPGKHELLLIHPKCEEKRLAFHITKGQNTDLGNIELTTKWLATHRVIYMNGIRKDGIVLQTFRNGDIEFSEEPNVRYTIKKEEYKQVIPLEN